MGTHLPTAQPFSFDQTLAFIRRFPPCQGEYIVEDDAVTAAVTIDERAVPLAVRRRGTWLEVETPRIEDRAAAVARAAHWIGADDDVETFYARADAHLGRVIAQLHAIYGAAYDEAAIAKRYGDQFGYWSFYVKAGAGAVHSS